MLSMARGQVSTMGHWRQRFQEYTVARPIAVVLLLFMAGCSTSPRDVDRSSPCFENEASYACQVERYQNVNAD